MSDSFAGGEGRISPPLRQRGVDVRKLRVANAMRAVKRCHAGLGFGGHGW